LSGSIPDLSIEGGVAALPNLQYVPTHTALSTARCVCVSDVCVTRRVLELQGNQLSGTLPDFVSLLKKLR
jgi:hypothetical protein